MNKKEECSIVEDLLYSYNEKILNQKSNEFVNNHLKNCDTCKNRLEAIRSDLFMERNREKQEDDIELTHLLKINRVIRVLKISLTISIAIIILFLGSVCFRGKHSEYVVNNAYNKLEELKQLDNFKITKRVKYISHGVGTTDDTTTELYYKDGKYKKIIPGSISFYEDNCNSITYVFEELKMIEMNYKSVIEHKGSSFEEVTGVRGIYYNEKSIFQKAAYEIRNDRFDGKDCYVISRSGNNNEYSELWINKENFITVRTVENYTAYYRETIYDIITNITLDSDVTLNINEYEGYIVKDLTENMEYPDIT